jgi:hypothetical protein
MRGFFGSGAATSSFAEASSAGESASPLETEEPQAVSRATNNSPKMMRIDRRPPE